MQANRALARLQRALEPVSSTLGAMADPVPLMDQVAATHQGFCNSMDDDFNTPGALGFLFELVRAINQANSSGVSPDAITQAQNALREFATVLGLKLVGAGAQEMEADPFVDLLVEIRRKLRGEKLWDLSDDIRDRLAALGVTLEDSKEGTTWRWD